MVFRDVENAVIWAIIDDPLISNIAASTSARPSFARCPGVSCL